MLKRQGQLDQLLKLDIANKGNVSSLFFCLFSVFSYLYGFGTIKYLIVIKALSIIMLLNSIIRLRIQKKILTLKTVSDNDWNILRVLIWINAIGFGIILNLSSFESQLSGIHFIIITTLLTGLVGSSIVTLSYFKELFIPFQIIMLMPQIGIVIYYYLNPPYVHYLPLIFLYLMYFVYQLRQFFSFRCDILKMHNFHLDLEIKNSELEISKKKLIDQTTHIIHSSRLAAIGEMSAGLVHEINNPITIIQASNKLIERNTLSPELSLDFITKNSQKISKSIIRINKIIKSLKNLANQSDDHPKELCRLNEIIEDTRFFSSEMLYSKNIDLIFLSIPEVKILCHPVQISQVLINLMKNASDCLEELTTDEKKWIEVGFNINSSKLLIYVKNSGPKIPDKIAQKLFDPFFSTKPVDKGTGLGLSISKNIIENHNGQLELDLVNPNTCFVITLEISQ